MRRLEVEYLGEWEGPDVDTAAVHMDSAGNAREVGRVLRDKARSGH